MKSDKFRGTVPEPCSRMKIRNSGIQRALFEGKKEALRNTKSDSRAFRGPKAFIMIIINLIIDKSRSCYNITIKY
jgi:hypothetical protein